MDLCRLNCLHVACKLQRLSANITAKKAARKHLCFNMLARFWRSFCRMSFYSAKLNVKSNPEPEFCVNNVNSPVGADIYVVIALSLFFLMYTMYIPYSKIGVLLAMKQRHNVGWSGDYWWRNVKINASIHLASRLYSAVHAESAIKCSISSLRIDDESLSSATRKQLTVHSPTNLSHTIYFHASCTRYLGILFKMDIKKIDLFWTEKYCPNSVETACWRNLSIPLACKSINEICNLTKSFHE